MDAAGRIVIPKRLRDAMGATGRSDVELTERDGEIVLSIAPTPMFLEDLDDGPVAATHGEPLPPLSVDAVREALERTRR